MSGSLQSSIQHLVYRRVEAGERTELVFAEPMRAEMVDRLQRAVDESATWGEFRARVGEAYAEHIDRESFDARGRPRPSCMTAFDWQDVPGYEDGDWPVWLASEHHLVLPQTILVYFAVELATPLNGVYWQIAAGCETELLAALAEAGIQTQLRQELCFR